MKIGKRFLSIILAVLMVVLAVPVGNLAGIELFPKAHAYNVGDHIQFGTYPQSQVSETTGLKNAANNATWKSYEYYSYMKPSNYMTFADFLYNGSKYRAVSISLYRPDSTKNGSSTNGELSCQDDNGYTLNNIYYFKYEPLIWRVLNPETGLVVCESIIDSQAYQNVYYSNSSGMLLTHYQTTDYSTYANSYASCTIRDWLNYDFYETSFSTAQKSNISKTLLNNDANMGNEGYNSFETNDRVFLLSYLEARNSRYFSSSSGSSPDARKAQGTDYAKCQGLSPDNSSNHSNNSDWWLRSPGQSSVQACFVLASGSVQDYDYIYWTKVGVRPACCLSTLKNDSTVSTELFSEESKTKYVTGVLEKYTEAYSLSNSYTIEVTVDGIEYSAVLWTSDVVPCVNNTVTLTLEWIDGEYVATQIECVGNNSKVFNEKKYIADIWLNRHGSETTFESEKINEILSYPSYSTDIVDSLNNNTWFNASVALWEGAEFVFDFADSVNNFTFKTSEVYEALIFDLLEKSYEGEECHNVIFDAIDMLGKSVNEVSPYYKLFNSIVSSIGNTADVIRNLHVENWHTSNLTVEQLMNLDRIKQLSDGFTNEPLMKNLGLFIKEAKTLADFFELVGSYQMALNMANEMQLLLKEMKKNTADDFLKTALEVVLNAVGNANWASIVCTTRFAKNTTVNLFSSVLKGAWTSNPYSAMFRVGYDFGKFVSNCLSNTDKCISNYMLCKAMKEFVGTNKKAINSLAQKYISTGAEKDAGAYVYAMQTYKYVYCMDFEQTIRLAKAATDEGILNTMNKAARGVLNAVLNQNQISSYDSLQRSYETISNCLIGFFDDFMNVWKFKEEYLKTDYPDQYPTYVYQEIAKDAYIPQVLGVWLNTDGKTMLAWHNPCVYKDKNGKIHVLYGSLLMDHTEVKQTVNGSTTTKTVPYGFENNYTSMYTASSVITFPKTYSLRNYTTTTGEPVYTSPSTVTLENPLDTPQLESNWMDALNSSLNHQVRINIHDDTHTFYKNSIYHVYRTESLSSGSYTEIKQVKRSESSRTHITSFVDSSVEEGKAYTYKVQTEYKLSSGNSIYSSYSNTYTIRVEPLEKQALKSITYGLLSWMMQAPENQRGRAAVSNESQKRGVILEWKKNNTYSMSTSADKEEYDVYKRASYSDVFHKVVHTSELSYFDEDVEPGVTYEYCVTVANPRTYGYRPIGLNMTISISYIENLSSPIATGTIEIPVAPSRCGHKYKMTVTKTATCTESGTCFYNCSICGKNYTESIPALGHSDANTDGKCDRCGARTTTCSHSSSDVFWTRVSPTCTEPGECIRICNYCNSTFTESVPALGHVDRNNDGKCDRCSLRISDGASTQSQGKACKWCGKVHKGFFQKIIGFFHKILAGILGAKYNTNGTPIK